MDRGFYSKANVDGLMAAHMKFLVGVPFTPDWPNQAVAEHGPALRRWENWEPSLGVYAARYDHPWERAVKDPATGKTTTKTKRSYLHLYYSPERAIDAERRLAETLSQLHAELSSGKRQDAHESLYERYFQKTKTGWDGRDDVIEAERARAGYQALLSNDARLDAPQALEVYRSKDRIEKAFTDVKDRLDMRTPPVHSHEALTGKLLCVFTALILTSELHQRIKAADLGSSWTMGAVLDELESVERYEHDGREPVVCHVTKKQRDLYQALGARPPA
jgi:transposase